MIGDDGVAQILTGFLHHPFYVQDLISLHRVLDVDTLDDSQPRENRIGSSQRQRIVVEPFHVWLYITDIEYRIPFRPFARITCVLEHQRTIVDGWCLHRELMQSDCG